MLNPFKIYALAADARRANTLLNEAGFDMSPSLSVNARDAIDALEGTCQFNAELRRRLSEARSDLAAANAKIARMTSGLKRGTTPKRGPEVSA